MIIPSGAVRVLVATRPVDFRKGMDGLAALAQESLGSDPYSGVIYVFRAKRADRVKLLLWDGSGLVLVAKRLEKSSFRWPRIADGVMRLTSSQLSASLEGLDWTRVRAVRVHRPADTACIAGGLPHFQQVQQRCGANALLASHSSFHLLAKGISIVLR
jgi:transposase